MIIDCISDLHGHYPELHGGDLLIVAGDLTSNHSVTEWDRFRSWISNQDYRKKIVIAGNHDTFYEKPSVPTVIPEFIYLCDSGTEFEDLKIWGSPWTKTFHDINPKCKAFTVDTEEELASKFSLIPRNTDILITHSPPFNFLDKTIEGREVGSTFLLDWIGEWKPRLHIFGHIHESYGQERSFFGRRNFGNKHGVTMINCSHVNESYQPVNPPIRIIL